MKENVIVIRIQNLKVPIEQVDSYEDQHYNIALDRAIKIVIEHFAQLEKEVAEDSTSTNRQSASSTQIAFEIECTINKESNNSLIRNDFLRGIVRQLRTFAA